MRNPDGFGPTWLTNWRRAAEVPGRTLVSLFVVTVAGAAVADYYATSLKSVPVSVTAGVACGIIVTSLARRKLKTYRYDGGADRLG